MVKSVLSLSSFKGLVLALLVGILGWVSSVHAQTGDIKQLFKQKKYDEIILSYRPRYRDLSIKELIILNAAYDRKKDLENQVLILNQIIKLKPDYFKAHYKMGEVNKKLAYKKIKSGKKYEAYAENLDLMIGHFKKAKKLKPKSIYPYRSLMEIYKDQDNVQEGLELSKEMVEVFGKNAETLLDTCYWMSKYGLVEQTRVSCRQASQAAPKNAQPYVLYARSFQDAGQKEEYEKEILKLLKMFPNNPEVVERAGLIYYENKDYFTAEDILKRNKNSDFELATIYYGFSLFQNQKYKLALNNLKSECHSMYDHKKEMIRFYEVGLRRLENHPDDGLWFNFRRAINSCRRLNAQHTEIKVRPGHFEPGVRLPANARYLEGSTIQEKRASYEESRKKGTAYKRNSKKILGSAKKNK